MAIFRIYLLIVVAALGLYTLVVGWNHGWNLIPIFIGNIITMDWQGQYNADFIEIVKFLGQS